MKMLLRAYINIKTFYIIHMFTRSYFYKIIKTNRTVQPQSIVAVDVNG